MVLLHHTMCLGAAEQAARNANTHKWPSWHTACDPWPHFDSMLRTSLFAKSLASQVPLGSASDNVTLGWLADISPGRIRQYRRQGVGLRIGLKCVRRHQASECRERPEIRTSRQDVRGLLSLVAPFSTLPRTMRSERGLKCRLRGEGEGEGVGVGVAQGQAYAFASLAAVEEVLAASCLCLPACLAQLFILSCSLPALWEGRPLALVCGSSNLVSSPSLQALGKAPVYVQYQPLTYYCTDLGPRVGGGEIHR